MPGYLSANKETLGILGMPLIQSGFSVLCISDLENNWSQEDWKGTVGFFPQISASQGHQCIVATDKTYFFKLIRCMWIKNTSSSL